MGTKRTRVVPIAEERAIPAVSRDAFEKKIQAFGRIRQNRVHAVADVKVRLSWPTRAEASVVLEIRPRDGTPTMCFRADGADPERVIEDLRAQMSGARRILTKMENIISLKGQ